MTADLSTLRSLKERLEKAEGPCRDIDWAIAFALGLGSTRTRLPSTQALFAFSKPRSKPIATSSANVERRG